MLLALMIDFYEGNLSIKKIIVLYGNLRKV